MLVDDEPLNLFAIEALATSMKLDPVVCSSGVEALSLYQKKFLRTCCTSKFDLVITDLSMPVMNGLKFAECIRAIETQFGERIAKLNKVGEIKSKLTSSYILLATANLDADINTDGMKFIDKLEFKPVTLYHLKEAYKAFINSKMTPKKYAKYIKARK